MAECPEFIELHGYKFRCTRIQRSHKVHWTLVLGDDNETLGRVEWREKVLNGMSEFVSDKTKSLAEKAKSRRESEHA